MRLRSVAFSNHNFSYINRNRAVLRARPDECISDFPIEHHMGAKLVPVDQGPFLGTRIVPVLFGEKPLSRSPHERSKIEYLFAHHSEAVGGKIFDEQASTKIPVRPEYIAKHFLSTEIAEICELEICFVERVRDSFRSAQQGDFVFIPHDVRLPMCYREHCTLYTGPVKGDG